MVESLQVLEDKAEVKAQLRERLSAPRRFSRPSLC